MKIKICTKCKIDKNIKMFHKHPYGKMGVDSVCKKCKSDIRKRFYLLHREQILQNRKTHRLINKDQVLRTERKYYKKNKEKINLYQKFWCKNNPEKVKLKATTHYKKNREKCREQGRNYYLKNKRRLNQYKNKYTQTRRKLDIQFKIKCNLRTRLNIAINGSFKYYKLMFLIGCEIDYLLYYLQSQFKEGMSWDNYGRKEGIKCWEIDHIKPCVKFNLSKPEEQRECFHYANLQPLWVKENRSKGTN